MTILPSTPVRLVGYLVTRQQTFSHPSVTHTAYLLEGTVVEVYWIGETPHHPTTADHWRDRGDIVQPSGDTHYWFWWNTWVGPFTTKEAVCAALALLQ